MYNFELLIIYLTSIVILTAVETLRNRKPFLPSHKHRVLFTEVLLLIVFVIPFGMESIFTSTLPSSLYIIIFDVLLKTVFLYNKYIINKKYQEYTEYILVSVAHRLLVIYICKNNFIYAFTLSSGTVILALITHIYVYRTYVRRTVRTVRTTVVRYRTRIPRNRSVSFSGSNISKERKLNNIMENIKYEHSRRIRISESNVPNNMKKLLFHTKY